MSSLSLTEARRYILHSQGLTASSEQKPRFQHGSEGTLQAITHLGYVQIDTISVVERAHHHIIWSRVPDYTPSVLHELQARDRKIFEYWGHAAAYLPTVDYRFCLPKMQAIAKGRRHWFRRNKKTMTYVLDRIRAEGPLRAKDFEAPKGRKGGTWFEWKPAKMALEQLFMEGELMIRERRGFQKVFDLTERVLPTWVNTSTPTPAEMGRYLVRTALRSYGLASEAEVRYLRKGMTAAVRKALAEMREAGEVTPVTIESLEKTKKSVQSKEAYFTDSSAINNFCEKLKTGTLVDDRAATGKAQLISPFDPLVIQRKRLQRFFGFDYQIECYVPGPKRKYGYFCLPVLWNDGIVGRIDVKADRKAKTLIVQALHFEPWFSKNSRQKLIVGPLQAGLQRFAEFNGCENTIQKNVSL